MWLPNFISDRVKNIASFKTIWNDSIVSGRSRLTKQIRFKAYLKRSETNWNDFTTIQNEFVRNWNDLKRIETILKRFWNESKLFWNDLKRIKTTSKRFWNDLKRFWNELKRFGNYFEIILGGIETKRVYDANLNFEDGLVWSVARFRRELIIDNNREGPAPPQGKNSVHMKFPTGILLFKGVRESCWNKRINRGFPQNVISHTTDNCPLLKFNGNLNIESSQWSSQVRRFNVRLHI